VARAAALGLLDVIYPEWRAMEGVEQNAYHHLDVWQHTLEVLTQFGALRPPEDLQAPVESYLAEAVTIPHPRRSLAHLGVLLHDAGKPAARTLEEDGRIRFLGHDRIGADIARDWAVRWRLSSREREFLVALVGLHMRPGGLAAPNATPRAIHRFFRDAGAVAPGLLLLNIADRLAARGTMTSDAEVAEQTEGSWRLLRRWVEMQERAALPLPVSGRDVMTALNLPPGPEVGRVLNILREIHAETPFPDREAALTFARLRRGQPEDE
jgi:hypothetical protein